MKHAQNSAVFSLLLSGPMCDEPAEGKRKGRPKAEVQELRSIPQAHMIVQWKEEFKRRSRVKCPRSGCWLEFPSIYGVKYHYQRCHGATVAEKLSHGCPYCEAVFATKVRLDKHKLWNHPDRHTMEPRDELPKLLKTPVKSNTKKRPIENRPPSPVFFKVKKTHDVSTPSQNGELAHQRSERKPHSHGQPSQQIHQSQPVFPQSQQSQSQSTSSDAEGSDSDEGSLPPCFPDEDPERMRHRRKQKTPKKFTGEQPSISGTFGLKGKCYTHRDEIPVTLDQLINRMLSSISERGEVVCPTCSIVTRKTIHGLKKHMEICQKLQDALKCQQCHKQFRSKAGLNYHTMAEHSTKPSGSEGQTGDEHEERERLRRVLKQMGRIKCPSEGCSAHFSSLMGYQYHQKRCGGEFSDDEKPVFLCQHCGKSYRSKAGRDYHVRTEHPPTITTMTDFERTPSGRVRRRSAQVAVFHLQEIAEDELAKDWGTKRRIKDDLVPDSKRLNYTRPGLPNFSPELLETWKNQVKEKGFICCINENCEAVYSSVSGLKAHLANCSQSGGELGKYTCLICQKEFSSESGVKYHISKTHSQNWFRAAATQVVSSSKSKAPEDNGIKAEVRNCPTIGKKRGRKPKERPSVIAPPQINTEAPAATLCSTPAVTPSLVPTQSPTLFPDPVDNANSGQNRQLNPSAARRSKPKRLSLSE
uniref:Zinc finger protein 512B n=1 Tax=Scophthalmus maximus TaxID=52904 RepID=A0A8D3A5R5_SCOMX